MTVRQWVGDLAFAILLAAPIAALARPVPVPPQKALVAHASAAHGLAGSERISVLG